MDDLLAEEHRPVLVSEVVDWLNPVPGGFYLDATLGLAGHTLSILDQTAGRASVLGCDRDRNSLEFAKQRIEAQGYSHQVQYGHQSFQTLEQWLKKIDCPEFNGVILDLGISSWQLQDSERGFSFRFDAPLDMRMNKEDSEDARDLVNGLSFKELSKIIWEYGEEPLAKRIAQRIVEKRQVSEIGSTKELARIVLQAYPGKRRSRSRNHPATKTFQALRIAVNSELQQLEQILRFIPAWCHVGARILVISFHSLEDRIVKYSFKRQAQGSYKDELDLETEDPLPPCLRILTKKPVVPSKEEKIENRRSRSSKLRVAEKI